MQQVAIQAPREVRLDSEGHTLELHWQQGGTSVLDAQTLRRACACAYCEAARRRGQAPVAESVLLKRAVLAGPAALQLFFSDGHERGRFPWGYLYQLAADHAGIRA